MSAVCQISGKRFTSGHNVSHSKRKTKRKMKPNLQNKLLINPATGRSMRVRISVSALQTLHKWDGLGKKYDLAALID